jgi:hypothetical protein
MSIAFKDLAADLLQRAPDLLAQWLPNGKLKGGKEWCVGSLAGEPGGSLQINTRTGVWTDHASGDKGGSDLISLYAALHNLSQGDAAKQLGGASHVAKTPARRAEPKHDWVPIVPVPEEALRANLDRLGADEVYEYRTEAGDLNGYILRFNEANGKKRLMPWTWCEHYDEQYGDWRSKGFVAPRPLYGLEQLTQSPGTPVVVVEGEKCANALRSVFPATPVLTWPGGSGAVSKTNWEPLKSRRVILWPDADAPGIKAMAEVSLILPMATTVPIPANVPEGWDAANALAEGWTQEQFVDLLKSATRAVPEVVARTTTTTQAIQTAQGAVLQRIEVREELAEKIDTVAEWVNYGIKTTREGNAKVNMELLSRIFSTHPTWKGKFWHDTFLQCDMTTFETDVARPITDQDYRRALAWCQGAFGLTSASFEMVTQAIDMVCHLNLKNELQDWLISLVWDGVPRIAEVFSMGFGAIRSEYSQRVGECWLISMIARALTPGCKVDTTPILEGAQGGGKSSGVRALGGKWAGQIDESPSDKDFYLKMSGKWLIEIAELNSFSKADSARIKGMLTTQVDVYRAPYGRKPASYPRQSVFVGTTNSDDWQQDDTGARRFWPIRCGGKIDILWLTQNREQLFAEARSRFLGGESWWEVPEEQAREETNARRPGDPWEEVLALKLDCADMYSYGEILDLLDVPLSDRTTAHARRISGLMRRLGWETRQRRHRKTGIAARFYSFVADETRQ